MDEFYSYMNSLAKYIHDRMKVNIEYRQLYDELVLQVEGTDIKMGFKNCMNEWSSTWCYHPVGAIAQELMYIIKNQWVDMLIRKDGV